jgi:hypothetical protein
MQRGKSSSQNSQEHTHKKKQAVDRSNKKTDHGYVCTYMVGLLGQFWRKKKESESFDDEDLNAYRIVDSNSSINEIEHTRDRRSGVWIC